MKDSESPPETGQVVRITKGRDAGKFAVVVGVLNDRFVFVADGEKRKFDRAKKKNVNHLECYPHISNEVKRSLDETGRVTNAKLRYALLFFSKEHTDLLKEGE